MSDSKSPNGWECSTLSSVAKAVVDCPHSTPEYLQAGVLVARTTQIKDGRFHIASASYVSEPEYRARISRLEPQNGDVILTREAPVGEAFVVPSGMRICLGQRVMLVRLDKTRCEPDFLLYLIYSSAMRQRFDQQTGGTTNPHLNVADIRNLSISFPPLPQQHKIARILTTLDNVIAQTEALITKYQAIKQGLMHDLFTRGVDATGKLRPPQSEAPELYRQSDLGWIPNEWEVIQLGEVIGPIVSGWSPICDGVPADQDEWAILKTTAVVWEGYQEAENKRLPKGLEPLADLQVQKDDILITRKGPMDRVGVVVHVHATRTKLMIPDTVLRLRILPGTSLLPAFVPLTLGSEAVQRDWLGRKIGLAEAQVDINHRILKGTIFAKPTIDEQTRIIERYLSTSTRIAEIKREVQKYRSVKTGLMQDLLTGKVLVKADEPEEITSHA